jgi:hypothetical protein
VCLPASSGGAIFYSPGWSDRGPRQTACGLVGWDRNREPLAGFLGWRSGTPDHASDRQDLWFNPSPPVMKTSVFMTGGEGYIVYDKRMSTMSMNCRPSLSIAPAGLIGQTHRSAPTGDDSILSY